MAARDGLSGIADIRRFFRTTETPVYFVSATAFNLLGMDRWLPSFRYLNYYDSFDGTTETSSFPTTGRPRTFESIEEICNYLLGHKEVSDFVKSRGPGGKAVFLMFDDETEQLAGELGLDVAFPPGQRCATVSILEDRDDRACKRRGRPERSERPGTSVDVLRARSTSRSAPPLGTDLVVQTPYGDSGQTTHFVASESDWNEVADELADEGLKVMKRIEPREAAIEGVVTRHGTLVGPLMTELTGFPELTPYGGGWCGNDIHPEALTPTHRAQARTWTRALGERLRQEGYRGYFDRWTTSSTRRAGRCTLGQLNPRVTGASSRRRNADAVAYGDMPLFLFHLLEFMDVDYEIELDDLNARWAKEQHVDAWSQFVLKDVDLADAARRTIDHPA